MRPSVNPLEADPAAMTGTQHEYIYIYIYIYIDVRRAAIATDVARCCC